MWASIVDVKHVGKSQILNNREKKWTDMIEIDRGNENLRNTYSRVWHTISADVMEIDPGNENLRNTLGSGIHIYLIEYNRY